MCKANAQLAHEQFLISVFQHQTREHLLWAHSLQYWTCVLQVASSIPVDSVLYFVFTFLRWGILLSRVNLCMLFTHDALCVKKCLSAMVGRICGWSDSRGHICSGIHCRCNKFLNVTKFLFVHSLLYWENSCDDTCSPGQVKLKQQIWKWDSFFTKAINQESNFALVITQLHMITWTPHKGYTLKSCRHQVHRWNERKNVLLSPDWPRINTQCPYFFLFCREGH